MIEEENVIYNCTEGFTCISRVSTFGLGHSGSSGMASTLDMDSDLYEAACPLAGKFSLTGFSKRSCKSADDCYCVSRSSADGTTEFKNGQLVESGMFHVQKEFPGIKPPNEIPADDSDLKHFDVIPHFNMRVLPQSYNAMDPYPQFYKEKMLPMNQWQKQYKNQAVILQGNLDKLYAWLKRNAKRFPTEEEVEQKGGTICRPNLSEKVEQNVNDGNDNAGFSRSEALDALTKIRRFQTAQINCVILRNTVDAFLFPEAHTFTPPTMQNCIKKNLEKAECSSLNCYIGPQDEDLWMLVDRGRRLLEKCVEPAERGGGVADSGVLEADETSASGADALKAMMNPQSTPSVSAVVEEEDKSNLRQEYTRPQDQVQDATQPPTIAESTAKALAPCDPRHLAAFSSLSSSRTSRPDHAATPPTMRSRLRHFL